MKIAVVGKGGSGKTIVAGTLARAFAANGYEVLAIDDDHDPDFAVSLGLPREADVTPLADDLVTQVDTPEEEPSWELTIQPGEIIDEYGVEAPDGVVLLRAGAVEAGGGAFGYSHITVASLLSDDAWDYDGVTIVDMPAGLEVPGMAKYVDALVMVVTPGYASVETIRKISGFASEYDVPSVRLVANDIRTDHDLEFIENYYRGWDTDVSTVIPHDTAVLHAEREGVAPFDYDDMSPAVRALRGLADDIMVATSP
jgi:CO dehydrogenase maturation factor